jgi:hypothetical protein
MAFFRSANQTASQVAPGGAVVVDGPLAKDRLRDAYDQGRIDERRRHHRSPFLTTVLVVAAVIGAVVLFYAVREGSFASGGAAVDNKISQVSAQAVPTVENAASNADALAQKAGDKLKSQGEAIQQDAAPASNQPAKGH